MLGIKLSDPMKPYSAADLRTGLRLVVSNSQPTNSSRMQPAASTTASRALLGSFPDGERTHALTQVVGRMLAVGLEPEEVAQLAQDWNARQSPPLDPDKVLSVNAD
ncbi:MAG: primase C-terminal domain-containing protein [Xanthomonadaceae bacterium]|nr:primase C-terminal domain-containing protein [Xanthomonadaceae bacterium]